MDVLTRAASIRRDPYLSLGRATGVIGLVWLPLLFGSVIALSSRGEPPLETSGARAATYFGNSAVTWVQLSYGAAALGMVASLWFFVAFGMLLARAEGAPPWRSAVATLSGALLGAYGLIDTSQQSASLHGGTITSGIADYAYHVGTLGFANAWIAIASFAVCAGWVVLSTGALERWAGWWLVAAGAGLVIARFVWTTQLWLLPYLLFWAWVLVLSVRLVRRPDLLSRGRAA
ncbi:MAG: hypothetical protein ACXV5Q_00015 [Frankiaceae bacterium]